MQRFDTGCAAAKATTGHRPILETLASNCPDAVQGQRKGAELQRGSAL